MNRTRKVRGIYVNGPPVLRLRGLADVEFGLFVDGNGRYVLALRRKCDRRRSEAASASERSARRALWAQRRRADRVVQLRRFGNLEQKFHDRVVVISRRALRHILLVKDSCSARDSVNGTEVAFH